MSLRVQLWSYNYDPEPTGIGPVSKVWAQSLRERGHEVSVVAAHPHYPAPMWGHRRMPYREVRAGVPVTRLPLWVGRSSGRERIRQEVSFAAAQTAAAPFLGRPDVLVAVSPSFPALAPAMAAARIRRIPWVLWLQDILPDGAIGTGMIDADSRVARAAHAFETAAYRSARRIVVISESFRETLLAKGVPAERIGRVYNPATRAVAERVSAADRDPRLVMTMGNIGHSQGLVEVASAFAYAVEPRLDGVVFEIVGDGVARPDVQAAAGDGSRVAVSGLVSDAELERLLRNAAVAVVSQRSDVVEFNLPSKLMNFLAYGIPVLAVVRPGSEAARIVEEADAGRVVDSARPEDVPRAVAALLADADERERLSANGFRYAQERLTAAAFAGQFEEELARVV
jgi:putative colanic acid biosynthesis glycosyltransferase WcaI